MPNETYGKWTVLHEGPRDKKSNKTYVCRCECGKEKTVRFSSLRIGDSTQCVDCSRKERIKDGITGKKIGKWSVIKKLGSLKNQQTYFLCRCECGTEKNVLGYSLREGKSSSCPHCRVKTHGMTYTSTFSIWRDMFQRCNNKNSKAYKYYGERGIKICERWLKFENFLEDMGIRPKGLSLDRVNNDGDYEPDNCRWATALQQRHNQRKIK